MLLMMKKEIKEIIKEVAKEINVNDIKNKIDFEKYTLDFEDVSELKIHKILYFLYGFYWSEKEEELFTPNFFSYKHGPVEKNYRSNKEIFIEYDDSNKEEVDKIIKNLLKYNVWHLVEVSHLTKPWIDSGEGKIYEKKIETKEIQEYFRQI